MAFWWLSLAIVPTLCAGTSTCPSPEICVPPQAAFQQVMDLPGRKQWVERGGYCGANSIQMILLKLGAWVSQDLVRQAVGNEMIISSNIGAAISRLRFTHAPFDTFAPGNARNATAYLGWMKQQLASGFPVIWFVYCKGDPSILYDHIEPVFGIYSNKSLNDTAWYPEDVLVHNSDYDQNHYYRPFSSLPDSRAMSGNCAEAPVGHGKNEMYPCVPNDVFNFGYSITGFVDPGGHALPTEVRLGRGQWQEPNLVQGEKPSLFNATVSITHLQKQATYTLFRWDDANPCPGCQGVLHPFSPSIPPDGNYVGGRPNYTHTFVAEDLSYVYQDPVPIVSSGATYYRCVPATAPVRSHTRAN